MRLAALILALLAACGCKADKHVAKSDASTHAPDVQPVGPAEEAGPASLPGDAVQNPTNPQDTGVVTTPAGQLWAPTDTAAEWRPWLPEYCPNVEVAISPAGDAPRLEWESCGDGCDKLRVNWQYVGSRALIESNVTKIDGKVRLGLHVVADLDHWWKALYDENDRPLGLWRSNDGDTCGGNFLMAARNHTCFVQEILEPGLTRGLHVLLDPMDPTKEPLAVYKSKGLVGYGCTDEFLVTADLANRWYARALPDGEESEIQVDGEVFDAAAVGDQLLVRRHGYDGEEQKLDGWIWSPALGAQKLVSPTNEFLFRFDGDGTNIVWAQMQARSIVDVVPGSLWVSPFGTVPDQLQPRRIGEVPRTTMGWGYSALAGNLFAIIEGNMSQVQDVTRLHLYRLSDGQRWEMPNPPGLIAGPILHLDADEIYLMGLTENHLTRTIIRQRLNALGIASE